MNQTCESAFKITYRIVRDRELCSAQRPCWYVEKYLNRTLVDTTPCYCKNKFLAVSTAVLRWPEFSKHMEDIRNGSA